MTRTGINYVDKKVAYIWLKQKKMDTIWSFAL